MIFSTFNENCTEDNILISNGNSGGRYIQDALYESYIQAKIDAEDRLAFAMKESMILSETDYSNIRAIQEAKIGDKIKAKWKKFVAFIKGMAARFLESLSNILLDEKEYLEKYKDIILKKKPKNDMEYSYTGNYEEGINRLTNIEVPLFDYYKYQKQLEADGEEDLAETIIQDKKFHYNDGETLSEQFKAYFLAYEYGQQKGKFSDLNMTDMYNFCYNFNKIKGIVDKDISRLEASTRAIESLINKELNATPETNNPANPESKSKEEGAILEAEDKPEGLKISKPSTDATSKMGSTGERNKEDENKSATAGAAIAKSDNKDTGDITKAADKWIEVCRPLIAAKLTACQQIAKDYMEIIRAHVRSYVGEDKKSKEGNKSPDKATKYSKNSQVSQAQRDAENAQKEADKADEEAKK